MRLYDLTEQYQDLLDMLEQDPDNEQLIPMLNGLEGAIEEKVENIIKIMKSLEAQEKAFDETIKSMTEKRTAIKNNIERLKVYTEKSLLAAGLEKVKGTLHSAWLQKNKESVFVTDESLIPKDYFKTPEPVLVKNLLFEDLKSGRRVPGAELKQSKSLRVR